jgi:hypothetical protein
MRAYPMMQRQNRMSKLPRLDCVLLGHGTQVLGMLEPTLVEYVPFLHFQLFRVLGYRQGSGEFRDLGFGVFTCIIDRRT